MEILIAGLGVIGGTYGYLFQKAGHNTEHLIRKGSPKKGISELSVELFDGRTNAKGEWKKDIYRVHEAQTDKNYDFIFISVPAGGISDVLKLLEERGLRGTIVTACGIWDSRPEFDAIMNGRPCVLGYPVAGGNLIGNQLNCCVFDHFMLEKQEKTAIPNYPELVKLFHDCDVKTETPYDMLEWIWLHMAINAAVITAAGRYGGIDDTAAAAEKLMDSAVELSEAVLSIRETAKIIGARGVNLKNYNNELLPYKIPSRIAGALMKKMFAQNLLTRKIMTLHSNKEDLQYVCRSIYDCGHRYSVPAPIFYSNYEKVFGPRP